MNQYWLAKNKFVHDRYTPVEFIKSISPERLMAEIEMRCGIDNPGVLNAKELMLHKKGIVEIDRRREQRRR